MSAALFAVLLAATLITAGVALWLIFKVVQQGRNVEKIQNRLIPGQMESDEFAALQDRPLLLNLARGGKRIEGWVDPENESQRLLVQAGWRSAEAHLMWYAFQFSIPLLGGVAILLFWLSGGADGQWLMIPMLLFILLAVSVLVPRWLLRSIAGTRRTAIKLEVPLFIHLLILLFEAGLSTRQALSSLVREGGDVLPQLGREIAILLRSLEAGADTGEVLKNLADVMEVEDLSSVLAVLRQIERYGGEIRQPLLETLAVLEERRSLDLRERVNLMSGRMTVVMVLFFFPALLIFVAGPAFMSIIRALGNVGS
jgi:tight adherence protein C